MTERPGPPASAIDNQPTPSTLGADNLSEMPHDVSSDTVAASVQENVVKKEEARKLFPVEEKKDEIIAGAQKNSVFLLEGETGSGKSSFAPGYVLEARLQQNPHARVIVTQPRRVAVEETYNRVKTIVGEDKVAFRHGAGKAGPENALITIMPDASLTNEIKRNPTLKGITDVVVDEAHEEGTNMIVNMGLLKKIQRERAGTGDPLHITYTTATFDKDKHLKYNPDAGDVHVKGRTFGVDERFIDAPLLISDNPEEDEKIKKRIFDGIETGKNGEIKVRDMPIVAARVTNEIWQHHKDGGDPVVILPGRAEIDAAVKEFKRINPDAEYAILMGGKQGDKDAEAFEKMHHEEGRRIAFFASEVVEASVTIDKATDVIDGGYSRKPRFDPKTGLSTLETVMEAKANNKQRVGRAGRTRKGRSITLLPQEVMAKQPDHLLSELQRADLTGMILILKAHGFDDIHEFDFIDEPDTASINAALQRLYQLGAIDENGKITKDIGEEMATMPLEPHLARMLIEAKRLDCVEEMQVVMGFLGSRKSPFLKLFRGEKFDDKYGKFIYEGSDILTNIKVWNEYVALGGDRKKIRYWAMNNHIDLDGLYDAKSIKAELSGNVAEKGLKQEDKPIDIEAKKEAIINCFITGLGDKVLTQTGDTYSLADGKVKGITLSNTSVVGNEPYIVSGNIRHIVDSGKTYANMNQKVDKDAYDMLMEKIKHTPSGVLLDKKDEETPPAAEKVVVPEQYEGLAPVVISDHVGEAAQEETEKIIEPKQEENHSFLHTVTTPIRWVREDAEALVGGVRKGVKWLFTGK